MKRLSTLLVVVLFLAACKQEQPDVKKVVDATIPVKVFQLAPKGGAALIATSGQFTTDDEAYLSFKTGGVIDRIYVKEGDAIGKGQLLAILKLTEIDAQVQQANLACEKARRDYERTTNLYKDSVATLEQLQNSKTLLDVSTQQLEAARFNRNYSEIRASKSGFVLRKMANEGQQVSSGTAVFQTNGATSDSWLLRVGVGDKHWENIHISDKATLSIDAGDKKEFNGMVIRKSQSVDPATGLFAVDVKIMEKNPGIASGMFGKALIQTSGSGKAVSTWDIPYECLLDADGSIGYVFVADGNTVTKTRVVIAGMEKDHVIISDGLQQARAIVTSGNAYLIDKSNIRVVQ